VAATADTVSTLSGQPARTRWWRSWWRRRDLDLKKLDGLIGVRQCELRRLVETSDADESIKSQANMLIDKFDRAQANRDEADEHIEELDELAPLLAGPHDVAAVLERELQRPDADDEIRLSTLFECTEICKLVEEYRASGDLRPDRLQQARAWLARLAREQNDLRRHNRAATRHKLRMIRQLFLPALLVLTAGFGLSAVIVAAGPQFWRQVLFATAAGALGSTLGGALKLRDLFEMDDVRRFSHAIALQPIIGAAAGLVVLLAYLQVHGRHDPPAWIAEGLVAFAGGFSEPVFLKTVEKLT
jgi:hypothetical protein